MCSLRTSRNSCTCVNTYVAKYSRQFKFGYFARRKSVRAIRRRDDNNLFRVSASVVEEEKNGVHNTKIQGRERISRNKRVSRRRTGRAGSNIIDKGMDDRIRIEHDGYTYICKQRAHYVLLRFIQIVRTAITSRLPQNHFEIAV